MQKPPTRRQVSNLRMLLREWEKEALVVFPDNLSKSITVKRDTKIYGVNNYTLNGQAGHSQELMLAARVGSDSAARLLTRLKRLR